MAKGENRKKDYDQREAAEKAQIDHYLEQQASGFEDDLLRQGRCRLFDFLGEEAKMLLIDQLTDDLSEKNLMAIRDWADETLNGKKKPLILDARGNQAN